MDAEFHSGEDFQLLRRRIELHGIDLQTRDALLADKPTRHHFHERLRIKTCHRRNIFAFRDGVGGDSLNRFYLRVCPNDGNGRRSDNGNADELREDRQPWSSGIQRPIRACKIDGSPVLCFVYL